MNIDFLKTRSSVVRRIREYFDARGYTEVQTPRLVGLPGQEPYLEPFRTEVVEASGTKHPAALITSPEYAMKRLLAAGMDNIYDLGPCFRNNEPWDGSHDPEFLMIEWYRKNAELASLMDETEAMVKTVLGKFQIPKSKSQTNPKFQISNNAGDIDSSHSFRRVTCEEAWKEATGTDLASLIGSRDAMAKLCRERGQTVNDADAWDDLYYKIFLSEIEPKLSAEPTFLYRYPISMAALSVPAADDPRFANRVELYVGGLELANGFEELADANVQRERFLEERALRASIGKPVWNLDEAFLRDLPSMGRAVGIALGVDRLAMLAAGAKSINDVIPFSARERFRNG